MSHIANPPREGICTICKRPLGIAKHWITNHPDGEHNACRRAMEDEKHDSDMSLHLPLGVAEEDIRAGDEIEINPDTGRVRRVRPLPATGEIWIGKRKP